MSNINGGDKPAAVANPCFVLEFDRNTGGVRFRVDGEFPLDRLCNGLGIAHMAFMNQQLAAMTQHQSRAGLLFPDGTRVPPGLT